MGDKILITGGCGFIGHHVVEHFLKNSDAEIYLIDKLSYAANGYDRLRDISVFDDKRVHIFTADFTLPIPVGILKEVRDTDYILHMGAETHVDNSIQDPESFVRANVLGTLNMLQFARRLEFLKGFNYFSTDEVFGPAPGSIAYREWDRYNSGNPYAASKAGGEELCLAFENTYNIPVFITHTMNCFGERQHGEKFIPLCIKKILNNEVITIHANRAKTQAGSRFYIHCRNVAEGLDFLLQNFKPGDKYNIVGSLEVDNLALAQMIGAILDIPNINFELVDFHSSRPGHDLRYALDGRKMKEMGWEPPKTFTASLEKTVKWYQHNTDWLQV